MRRSVGGDLPLAAGPGEVPHEHRRGQPAVDLELAEPAGPGALDHLAGEVGGGDRDPARRRWAARPRAASRSCTAPGRWSRPPTRSAAARPGPRAASSAGSTVEVSAVNGSPSRNHEVSLVVSASTIRRVLSGSGRAAHRRRRASRRRAGRACGRSAAAGPRPGTPCPAARTIALSRCTSSRTQSKLVAVRVIGHPRRAAPAAARAGQVPLDGLGDPVQRQDLVGEAGLGDRAGHAPDDRGRLVLHEHGAAGVADLAGAVAAVGAHAGEDDGRARRRRRRRRPSGTAGRRPGRQKFSGGPWVSAVRTGRRGRRGRAGGGRRGRGAPCRARSGLPSAASTTRSAQSRSSRWANCRVKTGGMCWTSSTGTGREAGSCGSTLASASGPPVEEPMTSTAGFVRGPRARAAAGRGGDGGGAAAAGGAAARDGR